MSDSEASGGRLAPTLNGATHPSSAMRHLDRLVAPVEERTPKRHETRAHLLVKSQCLAAVAHRGEGQGELQHRLFDRKVAQWHVSVGSEDLQGAFEDREGGVGVPFLDQDKTLQHVGERDSHEQ